MRRPARIVRPALITLLPVAVLALAACSPTSGSPLLGLGSPTPSGTPTPTASAAPAVGIATIGARARDALGGGAVVSLEQEADATSWEARVVAADGSEQEVHYGADGSLRSGPTPVETDADEQSKNRALTAAVVLDVTRGVRRMAAAVPGGQVTGVDLEEDSGRVVWEGDVLDRARIRHEVRIDAVSGAVLVDQADGASTATGS